MISNVNKASSSQTIGFRSEEKVLRDNCTLIGARVAQSLIDSGSGLRCSAYKNMLRQYITQYLEGVGTSTAEKLLIEYQRGDFNNI